MAERNGRCKEVYETCPQHIGFLSGFAVSLEFDELKGKFSSGREGALASKFNYDFK